MDIGYVKDREITTEIKEAYLEYAMSVIISRALPDVRDGLKPVHRRILYAMNSIGLRHTSRYRKSANVVGEVLGKYHPHGDVAVYDAMVRLAQTFSMRYPLIDGQGNFGSLDGDKAASMRYTEARLASITDEMLQDIDKKTVNFIPNYDGSHNEPTVLPAKLPQLLINGVMGIAVGMMTNIPPHNLTEIIEGILHLIDNPEIALEDLTNLIKGPDFPTGGIIYNSKEIKQAYASGKGSIVCRAKTNIQEDEKGKFHIIVNEIPYQVNKSVLIEKMADLVKDKKIDGIRDIRDESDKDGVRIVIDLKSDAYPQKVLNILFKLTDLQKTFHLNMLALIDGMQPRVLTIKMVLEEYIKHRQEIVTRRTQFELDRAKERAHILEGLKKALDHINEVIETIKSSKTKEIAHANLMKKFKLSDRQTTAILEMKLQTLAGLERQKIEDELAEKLKLIIRLEDILNHPKKILGIIKDELIELKEKHGDERKTKLIKGAVGEFSQEDLIPNEETIITVTKNGYIKRLNPEVYKVQKRGGKGIIGMVTREEDVVEHFLGANTHDDLLFFTNQGKVYRTKTYEIPEASRTAKGQALVNFLSLAQNEIVTSVVAMSKDVLKTAKYLTMATKKGIIKKTEISEFDSVRRSGLIAITLKEGDELCWVSTTSGEDDIFFVSRNGQAIRFKEQNVRFMGRAAAGVMGIRLKKNDELVDMGVIRVDADKKLLKVLVVAENGYGKKSSIGNYKIQYRGGSGIKTSKITSKTGNLVCGKIVDEREELEDLIVISSKGQVIRIPLAGISTLGRATQGVRIMKLESGHKVASTTII